MAKKKRSKLKKALKMLGAGAAIAGLGKAFMNARNRNAMINSATADDGFGFMTMKDYGPFSKAKNFIPRPRRDSILAKPNINRMDLSEVDMDYQAPDMSKYRNTDFGLEPFAAKDGGKVVKTGEKVAKRKKKKSIQIRGFGKARRG